MNARQMMLNEFTSRVNDMEKETNRRKEVLNYLKQNSNFSYEDIVCALSWLDHTTKTAENGRCSRPRQARAVLSGKGKNQIFYRKRDLFFGSGRHDIRSKKHLSQNR